jgi:Reverse transcriptase (RNA-dependent DNA polymerase)/RNase H-like domain found in reverse transcriptase
MRPGHSCSVWAASAACAVSSETPSCTADAGDGPWKPADNRLFFIWDSSSSSKLLVDTGSSFSILPHKLRAPLAGPLLRAADGRRIRCWGSKQLQLSLQGTSYSWQFLLVDLKFPILGVDFLRHFGLLEDVVGGKLLPRSTLPQPPYGGVYAMVAEPSEWQSILAKFPQVSQPFTVASSPRHGVEHQVITTGRPTTAKFRRLDPARLAAAKAEFNKMLKAGVVRLSSSSWASPLHMVRKKDGDWRPCGDFRRLNVQITDDKYPLPNMGDLSSRLDGCTIFTKLDLQKGYFQVPVAAADVPKTAVITPFGLFEFVRMLFGLKNAGMTFQRLMDRLFFDIPFVFVYLDDLLVARRSAAEHRRHLREVLQRLQDNGLVLNADKCVWGQSSLEFLGHQVSAQGVAPLVDRIAAVIRLLTDTLRGGLAGTKAVQWSAAMEAAFQAAKAALQATALLEHPASGADLSLVTDASSSHLGAVLQQRRPGGRVATVRVLLAEAVSCGGEVQRLRPQAAGGILQHSALPLYAGRPPVCGFYGP